MGLFKRKQVSRFYFLRNDELVVYINNQANTHFGESLCVSNELVAEKGRITIEEGLAWMILSRD